MVKVSGHRCLMACGRLMGMIPVILSVQMLLDYFKLHEVNPASAQQSRRKRNRETEPGAALAVAGGLLCRRINPIKSRQVLAYRG